MSHRNRQAEHMDRAASMTIAPSLGGYQRVPLTGTPITGAQRRGDSLHMKFF